VIGTPARGCRLNSGNQFNASGSLAGYLFQCRLALLLGLQTVKRKPNGHISIEKFDDIAFESDDLAECLIQAKHHIGAKNLSDSSEDIWKTLRIWMSDFTSRIISNSETRRLLITTALAAEGSAMSMLRPESSNELRVTARLKLQEIAKQSKNVATTNGRSAFLALTDQQADLLLSSIWVIDRHPNLHDVMDEIEGELRILAPSHPEKVAEALEGWWLKVVGKRLIGEECAQISVQDIMRKAHEIGGWYRPDGLPVSDPAELGDKPYHPDDEGEIYVKQMRLIQLSKTAVESGIRDFYRSNAQRSKWARENLLLDGEASRYDAKIKDQWERRFEQECGSADSADDNGKRQIGRNVFFWANQQQVGFRNVVETWITSGSFHGLSDRLEVGWHPDFNHHLGDDSNGGNNDRP
jgi:hypothetical protein